MWISPTDACPYLPGREERLGFLPVNAIDETAFSRLIQNGFRRAGTFMYKPLCVDCTACISCRVDARSFSPSKRFKRIMRANVDLCLSIESPGVDASLYDLFSAYMSARHSGGPMDSMSFADFKEFVETGLPWSRLYKWYNSQGEIFAAMIVDQVSDGLSAVYSFFDPADGKRSLGNFMILSLITQIAASRLSYLYLGYYIEDSSKMRYKADFQPLEMFRGGVWSIGSASVIQEKQAFMIQKGE